MPERPTTLKPVPRSYLAAGIGLALVIGLWVMFAGAPVEVNIPEGAKARDVAQLLKEDGVLRLTTPFRLLAKLTGLHRHLKPGHYQLRHNMSSPEVIWRLVHGGGADFIRVTIPEGWRMEQIAERLEESGVTQASEFEALVREQGQEGYLFPTTYYLSKAMPAAAVAKVMRAEFEKQVIPVYRASGRSLDIDKVVTLASIIEREAVIDSEKPTIASVYFNRFAHGMKLEADPTVQYALGNPKSYWKKGLTLKDLQIDSPYNTYQHTGMPPAPICNPGLHSIQAVLYPQRTDYVFFMADYKGGHTFQSNYADFLKAKEAAKRELKHQKEELKRKKKGS